MACRRCWGLTYVSRALQNYKESIWGRGQFAKAFGTTQREWSTFTTREKRRAQRKRSLERWSERKRLRLTEPSD